MACNAIVIDQSLLDDLSTASAGLSTCGWVMSPYLSRPAIREFSKIAQNLARYSTASPSIREAGLARANNELVSHFAKESLDYERMARLVGLYIELPVVGRFSHLIEMAIIEQYRFNHVAALYLGLPQLEGVIHALVNDTTSSVPGPFASLTAAPGLCGLHRTLFLALHNQLSAFVATVYQPTPRGLGIAALNRHHILHAFGSTGFSVPANSRRVLMAIEVLAALEQLNTSGTLELPALADVPNVNNQSRTVLYEALVRQGLDSVSLARTEFLRHHKCFDWDEYFGET